MHLYKPLGKSPFACLWMHGTGPWKHSQRGLCASMLKGLIPPSHTSIPLFSRISPFPLEKSDKSPPLSFFFQRFLPYHQSPVSHICSFAPWLPRPGPQTKSTQTFGWFSRATNFILHSSRGKWANLPLQLILAKKESSGLQSTEPNYIIFIATDLAIKKL